ncbi:uncharacterized protein CTRU02_206789 [Colletotrichum truncatum]|uniref:Uncharacterized protein n=1 Tax=Colletotrichum truncatum TaxID=5467 RepID=A0ACC3YYM0_COLTU
MLCYTTVMTLLGLSSIAVVAADPGYDDIKDCYCGVHKLNGNDPTKTRAACAFYGSVGKYLFSHLPI